MNYCYNIVGEPQKLCAERKKPYTQEDGLDDSIPMTVPIRQKDSDKKDDRNVLCFDGGGGYSDLYMCQTHWTIDLKGMHLLYANCILKVGLLCSHI